MKDKALDTVKKYKLINNGDTIVVGFSGGADSSALLHFLFSLKQEFQLKIYACHINHNLRGKEALRDQEHCTEFCKKLGIPLYIYSININQLCKENGKSTELCAREERYKIFNELSQKFYAKIATAHSLTDNCETIIWNMCRGTALKGLTGIPAKRDYIIRPLIECTRVEVEEYCKSNDITFVTDSTNLTNDYTRNIIRNNIAPVLKKLNSNYENNMGSMAICLNLDNDFLDQFAENILGEITYNNNYYNYKILLLKHEAIIYRVIAKILYENNIEISNLIIKNVIQCIKEKKILQLNKTLFLLFDSEFFYISTRKTQCEVTPYFHTNVKLGNNFVISGKSIELIQLNYEQFNNIIKINKKALNYCLDYDKITLAVHIRQKKDGDKISLYNRNGTKTLKKLFNEAKIPIEQRSRLFVLCDNDEIVWLEHFGCSKKVSVDNKTKNILFFKVTEE